MTERSDNISYRVNQLEEAVETMAHAAEKQTEFNTRVEIFMARVQTWGYVSLLVYGTGQAALVAAVLGRG